MSRDRLPSCVRALLPLLLLAMLPCAAGAQAPLSLFNGTSLLGWNAHGSWAASAGNLTTAGGGSRSVLTAVPFAEMRLELEYNESTPMGAKLRLWANREDSGGLAIDLDTAGSSAGVGGIEALSHSSINNVPQGWHHLQLEASHGSLNVRVDGQPSGSASGLGSRAGFLGFEAGGDGTLQLRNIKLVPLALSPIFNGADLSGWKSIARGPEAKAGVGHDLTKTLTLGIGGGSAKPHEAKWMVLGGSIHGQDGPGGLEDSSPVEDGIFQITASMRGDVKKDSFLALGLRDAPGQLDSGYDVGIAAFAGGIANLANRPPLHVNGPVDETIVLAGRTIAVWVGGVLTTVHTDTRAENSNPLKGAKTGSGTVILVLPSGGQQIDVHHLAMAMLPSNYGVAARAPAPPPPVPAQSVAPATTAAVAAPAAPSAAEKALLEQQQAAAKKDATDQAAKQRVATLMSQALATTDPQQQQQYYGQVVQIDPSNAAAVQGYKEAQAKVQAAEAAQQQAAMAQVNQQQAAQTRDQQAAGALTQAQGAFLGGHLKEASAALLLAERLTPDNPAVRDLRSRINSARSLRQRVFLLGSGAGLVTLVGGIGLWLRRRKQQRYPVLEVTRGLDEGRTFPLDKDLVRIGAVSQNGGQKNDIVLQDVEHAISRFHCEVARKNGQLYVTDLKSSNGTRINGESLQPGQPELLRRGSVITLANNIDLRFGYDRRAKTQS